MNAIHRIFKDGVAIEKVNLLRATINNAQEIKDNLLDDIDCNKIIVDLSSCDYIDSTFFGAMVFGYRVLKHQGCSIAIVISNTFLSKSFIYKEISSVFKVYPTMINAMNALNNDYQNVSSENYKSPEEINQSVNIGQPTLLFVHE
jgi:anti-anti-sigma factor